MMRSMFADQPYSPVTRTHGESARRVDTTTLSTLSSRTSFMSLQRPSVAALASSSSFFSSSVSSILRPSLVAERSFLPSYSLSCWTQYSSMGSVLKTSTASSSSRSTRARSSSRRPRRASRWRRPRRRRRSSRRPRPPPRASQAHEGGPRRQGRQGRRVHAPRRLAVRPRHGRVRLVREHGAHHEGPGAPRLVVVGLHVVEEDHGDQPPEPHRQVA